MKVRHCVVWQPFSMRRYGVWNVFNGVISEHHSFDEAKLAAKYADERDYHGYRLQLN